MKIAVMIARYLLGFGFVLFGLNGFLNFLPQPPLPNGPASDYLRVLGGTHYMVPVFAFQLVAGVLLLVNRYVPLAIAILAPILVNILMFHSLMQPAGLPVALVFVLLWLLVALSVKSAFAGLFQARVEN